MLLREYLHFIYTVLSLPFFILNIVILIFVGMFWFDDVTLQWSILWVILVRFKNHSSFLILLLFSIWWHSNFWIWTISLFLDATTSLEESWPETEYWHTLFRKSLHNFEYWKNEEKMIEEIFSRYRVASSHRGKYFI